MTPEERAGAWISKHLNVPKIVRALLLRTLARQIREAEQAAIKRIT